MYVEDANRRAVTRSQGPRLAALVLRGGGKAADNARAAFRLPKGVEGTRAAKWKASLRVARGCFPGRRAVPSMRRVGAGERGSRV